MRTLGVVFAIAAATSALASDITWHQGSIVLANQTVVVGQIARQSFDLVLHRNSDGQVASYPAHKVSSFRYYDETEKINRSFVSIARKYYERVVTGKLSVLRIQHDFDQKLDEESPEEYSYYIVYDKTVRPLKSFRNKYFSEVCKELDHQLVSHKHLNPNTRYGALSLIILYNDTVSSSQVASLN